MEQKFNGVSSNVRNTGTDMIVIDDKCILQVSVWDGSNSGFGWIKSSGQNLSSGNFSTTTTYFTSLGSELSDPDVVIALSKKTGKIHAKVVGIDDDNFVASYTFLWTGAGFTFEGKCRYGAAYPEATGTFASGYTYGRVCSSPNIDANADGETVITWTETEEFAVEASFGFPFPQPNSQFLKLKRGNVLGAYGDIADRCLGCSKTRLVFVWEAPLNQQPFDFGGNGIVAGFSVLDPSVYPLSNQEYLFPAGWFAHSDVSISEFGGEKDHAVISFVFYDYKYFGNTSNPLFINQFEVRKRENGCPIFAKSWNSFSNYPGGRPRIASPTRLNPGNYDFHVALGFSGSNTDCFGNYSEFSSLSLLGVYGGSEINGGQAVSIINNADLTGNQNSEPSISYMRPKIESGKKEWVVVAWTHRGSAGTDAGEIIAKLYKPDDASPVSSEYSLVNEFLDNNQYVSSVSARRTEYVGTYFWAESSSNGLECKISPYSPGVDKLESMVTCQEIPPGDNPESVEGFSVFPNPSNGELNVSFKNKDIEMGAVKIELIGSLGQKIPSRFDPKTGKLSPMQKTSPGIYNLRVIAGERVFKQSVQIK